jgi:hypothetical protein
VPRTSQYLERSAGRAGVQFPRKRFRYLICGFRALGGRGSGGRGVISRKVVVEIFGHSGNLSRGPRRWLRRVMLGRLACGENASHMWLLYTTIGGCGKRY